MCGIVGVVAERNSVPVLLEGLRRLEYRGYDSAGLAVIDANGRLERLRTVGKVRVLQQALDEAPIAGHVGIAHTRWATHGVPSMRNAHPQISRDGIAVVHNGIIENHERLRAELKELGYAFSSETDTEVVAHRIHQHLLRSADLFTAVRKTVAELHGAYALAVVSERDPECIVVARAGCPVVIGLGVAENFVASDVAALLPVTRRFQFLEEGDVAEIRRKAIRIVATSGLEVTRAVRESDLPADAVERGQYRHFMLKEIHEQPRAIAQTLEERVAGGRLLDAAFGPTAHAAFANVKAVHIAACGTSYHAGLAACFFLEQICRIPARVEFASEYRYRDPVVSPGTLFVTTQLAALGMLIIALGKKRHLDADAERSLVGQLLQLPGIVEKTLALDPTIQRLAERFVDKHHALFLGRGPLYAIAMEGALKLKEISYIHAEGYAAAELKHGPLALVDEDMPVVAVAPNDELLEKLKSNLQEVRARGGQLIVFADPEARIDPGDGITVVKMPAAVTDFQAPLVYAVPLQLLAYHVAVLKGTDVDQPRNLAKSLTVE